VKFGAGTVVADFIDLKDSKGDATDATAITFTRDAANGLDAAAVKNTTSGGATLTENGTQTGVSTSVFGWTNYGF
ncbi:MAG TPA: hypothetical protein PLA69_03740, partial [Flavobacterium sp.]|nr:hypothetical protein [Flavobacterium sp.]